MLRLLLWAAQGDFAYTYDNLNRVTSAVIPPFTEGYSYDPWGNQTEHTLSAGTGFDWHYLPTTSNQASSQIARYDAAGNMVWDGQHTYSYDAESRVATVDAGVTYQYDPEGLRVATVAGGAVSAEHLYDMAGSLVTTVNGQGQMVRTILRDNGGMHWGDYVGSAGAGGLRTEFRLVNQVGTLVANGDTKGELYRGLPERAIRRRAGLHPELRLHRKAFHRQAEGRGNGERLLRGQVLQLNDGPVSVAGLEREARACSILETRRPSDAEPLHIWPQQST